MQTQAKLSQLEPAKYLTANFEGYFMCRMATDPDPTNEKRGMSGYTMALVEEDPLDQVIRLQVGEPNCQTGHIERESREHFLQKNLRSPAREMKVWLKDGGGQKSVTLKEAVSEGVRVTSVNFDGKPWSDDPNKHQHHPLVGARVSLLGRDRPFQGAIFEGRNNITGSGDDFAFAIDPFILQFHNEETGVRVVAEDYFDPAKPELQLWEILEPPIYGRRLPTSVESVSIEVQEAINTYDFYGYFRARRQYLSQQIEAIAARESPSEADKIEAEQFKSRLYQLEYWGDRIISKLGNRVEWSFDINGPKDVDGNLLGEVNREQFWPVKLWFGGWDGDLMIGYVRGSLNIPFKPHSDP